MREKLLKLWYAVANGRSVPTFSVANYQDIAEKGVFAPVWLTAEKGTVSLHELPTLGAAGEAKEFIGKEKPDPAGSGENAVLPGFQGFFLPTEEKAVEEQSNIKSQASEEDDTGIVWTVPGA
jgi:hypothetical protein